MGKIYLLQLQQNKYYVGYTKYQKLNLDTFKPYKWIRKYPIVKVLKYVNTKKYFLNYYVRSYMLYYGFDNLRGGNYTRIKLRKKTIKWIEKHTHNPVTPKISIIHICPNCGQTIGEGHKCPTYNKQFRYLLTCFKCGLEGHNSFQCFYYKDFSSYDLYSPSCIHGGSYIHPSSVYFTTNTSKYIDYRI